jgi:hypothetical protein
MRAHTWAVWQIVPVSRAGMLGDIDHRLGGGDHPCVVGGLGRVIYRTNARRYVRERLSSGHFAGGFASARVG